MASSSGGGGPLRKRQAKKIMGAAFLHGASTILRAQISYGLKGKGGRWLEPKEEDEGPYYCPTCGTGDCTCGGTGLRDYGEGEFCGAW